MIKYMEISNLNNDQVKVIKENGWCIFTECDSGGTYYSKGFAWANRIGYIIFSESVNADYINSYDELNKIAIYDNEFDTLVRKSLKPLEDKCYVFLVKDPAHYHFDQIWTNKGLERAKKMAQSRFAHEHQYYESKDYDEMHRLISKHNSETKKRAEGTADARCNDIETEPFERT